MIVRLQFIPGTCTSKSNFLDFFVHLALFKIMGIVIGNLSKIAQGYIQIKGMDVENLDYDNHHRAPNSVPGSWHR